MKLVGLSGKIGCGKTTVAQTLIGFFSHCKAARVAFGDLLKREVAETFGIDPRLCYDSVSKEVCEVDIGPAFPGAPKRRMTIRELLQWYGTEYRRAITPGYWVEAMETELIRLTNLGYEILVVDDVRFLDEAQLILRNGGLLYRLRPFHGWKPGPFAGHISETALDNFDGFTAWLNPQFGDLESAAHRIFCDMNRRLSC